ncbi:MAG: hypothetical protein M0Q23_03230 [Syntrophales bacterium]|jgi:hypothetical protein|nr:hypothetical protein [Syntrophales bacterium]
MILHAKGIMRPDKHEGIKRLSDMFDANQPVHVPYEGMYKIFVFIKQDCARMLFDWLGVKDAPILPEEMIDVAIQKSKDNGLGRAKTLP